MLDLNRYLRKMEQYFGNDHKRIAHAHKVHHYATQIAAEECDNDQAMRIVLITACLHDIGIKLAEQKYGSSAPRYQEQEGPAVAAQMMTELGEPQEVASRVQYIIGHHHTATAIDGLDFQIIWEADMLVNMQEEGWDSSIQRVREITDKHLKTATGREIARVLYHL